MTDPAPLRAAFSGGLVTTTLWHLALSLLWVLRSHPVPYINESILGGGKKGTVQCVRSNGRSVVQLTGMFLAVCGVS